MLSERFDVPAEKGPADLKRLPAFFGQADARSRYGARDVRVFAEINNVPHLDREQIVAAANYYRDAGADVIDLGLSLDRKWLDDGPEVIADLKAQGFVLSIDTLDPDEILMADAAGVDYVLSLTGHNRHIAEQLQATPVLIPDTPDDLDSLDATIAHLRGLGKPFLVDPIIEPIGSGFAASLGRYLETRRRHPDVEMLMGIGNITELTEADTTGVTALLIGFCQEVGIRNVLTTEVINWARGAVRETVLAAQLMHFAQRGGHAAQARRRPAADDQGRGVPALHRGRAARAAREHHRPQRPHLHGRRLDLRVQRRALRQGHRHQPDLRRARRRRAHARLLPGQGAHEGVDRPRAGEELPAGVPARLGLSDVRRAAPRARPPHRPQGGIVKKVLLQLDTDEHPSPFDAIVAARRRRGRPALPRRREARGRRAGSCRTRSSPAGSDDLKTTAVWVGGKHVATGEEIFDAVQKAFFGPFRVSVMLDSNGCNTTAATTIARIAKERDLSGTRAVVLGLGAVGLRSAVLLQHEGCEVVLAALPSDLFDDDRPYRRPRGARRRAASSASTSASRPTAPSSRRCSTRRRSSCPPARPACRCCGATSGRSTRRSSCSPTTTRRSRSGIEGTKATDDMADYDGKLVLGALAIGGPKMKVHKACVRRLFESNDQVLDTDAVYEVAKELV